MDDKTYALQTKYGDTYEIRLHCHRYEMDGSLAVMMDCRDPDYGYWEPYADLTVFISPLREENAACVDANNLGEEIVAWCEDNGIAYATGERIPSGFCSYPVMKFTAEFLANTPSC